MSVAKNSVDLPASRQHKNLLFDFYGVLLTDRQREIFSMHYADDCSFAEIGEALDITPQAVADMLKRTSQHLDSYEKALGLAAKFQGQQVAVEKINAILNTIESNAQLSHLRELIDELVL